MSDDSEDLEVNENDDDDDAGDTTTEAAVATYEASTPIFAGVLREVRELSKKKPEAVMSVSKVKLVNRVLSDLLTFLRDEPAGKYLHELAEDELPQMSDAVLTMVQFEAAIDAFASRYHRYFVPVRDEVWVTKELVGEVLTDEDDEAEREQKGDV